MKLLRLAVLGAMGALVIGTPAADAAYTGAVDPQTSTATLTGASSLNLTTGSGLVHHGEIGAGFNGDTDFDSNMAGDQTVPDTGGWTVDVTGTEELEIEEGEPPGPISFAYGHTFFPGGVPCVVRDPNDRHGATIFSLHPSQETRFCYHSGFQRVTTRASDTDTDFAVLDTEKGVPLTIAGGAGNDSFSEAANVPSGVGTPHNALSSVSFSGGGGEDQVTLNDGPVDSPATYTIGDGEIRKTGLQPIFFDSFIELLALYPQDGPSTIKVGRTGGASLQIFGGFHGQHGPDKVDATRADAPLYATGSSGDDTIVGSVYPDYIDGGGGNDSIDSVDASFDQVLCNGGTGRVRVDTVDRLTDCPTAQAGKPFTGFLHAAFKPRKVKRGKRATLDVVSTVTLTFGRHIKKKTVDVPLGPSSPTVKLPRSLKKGRHKVTAQLKGANGRLSKPVKLTLTVR